jgi:hypothetical protein
MDAMEQSDETSSGIQIPTPTCAPPNLDETHQQLTKHNKRSCIDESGDSTDALADSFSCSLAQIASASSTACAPLRRRNCNQHSIPSSEHALSVAFSTVSASSSESAAAVSATTGTQTSSGDDRDSSGSGCDAEEVNGGSQQHCKAVASMASETTRIATTNQQVSTPLEPFGALIQPIEDDRPHFHRHVKKHSLPAKISELLRKPCTLVENDALARGSTVTGTPTYKLESLTDSIPLLNHHHQHQQHQPVHKTVVAHRLPLDSAHRGGARFESGGSSSGDTTCAIRDMGSPSSLLQPFREPCFHTIRQTFKRFVKRAARKSGGRNASVSGEDESVSIVRKRRGKKRLPCVGACDALLLTMNKSLGGIDDLEEESSGSANESGYGASNSSNGKRSETSSFPSSEDSSEDSGNERKRRKGHSTGDPLRPMLSKKRDGPHSSSSEIADFSSTFSLNALKTSRCDSPSLSSSSCPKDGNADPLARSTLPRRLDLGLTHWSQPPSQLSNDAIEGETGTRRSKKHGRNDERKSAAIRVSRTDTCTIDSKPLITSLGCDLMAHVLTFLEPPDILDVLTMPLSKDWLSSFTSQAELWRVLCLLEPFKAQVEDERGNSDSESSDEDSAAADIMPTKKPKFRLLYTSYVRCMRCLIRIKDDAINGRPLTSSDYTEGIEGAIAPYNVGANHNLQQFLSRARGISSMESDRTADSSVVRVDENSSAIHGLAESAAAAAASSTLSRVFTNNNPENPSKPPTLRVGRSGLKQSASYGGDIGPVELPWSCGIHSIVNWMVAFTDVEGIQTMCLRVLPFLLENEQQRITAQRAGLTDIVLRGMVLFPESTMLHTAAFHTIVLLARPLGGQEGMLFHTSMVNSSGIFSSVAEGSASGKSGIAVLLDSMRRFQSDEVLQSMACWSLVNIALAPVQKEVLVKLGGIEVILNAMMEHQYCAEVQFRALFALINLVIPSAQPSSDAAAVLADCDSSEREMLDEMVDQIVRLVVTAMRNYCSNEAILNRACLVLHNLSLTQGYHLAMLWAPNCYQLLEWCLRNYRTDQVLQQSAAGTLHRLQMTLSGDASLRERFAASIQALQKQSVEHAHHESTRLQEQSERQLDDELTSQGVSCQ